MDIHSQDTPLKWKEIAMEDLQMQSYEPDTSVSALVLYDFGRRYFDINPNGRNLFFFNDRHIRIKILKPEGIKYARVRVSFKDMNCEQFPGENSIIIKGMTYNLDKHGKIIASKLKQNSIKYIDSAQCDRIAEFFLPDVKPGSVIEYKISIPMLDMVNPEEWYFQREIPTRCSEFLMRVPNSFNYIFSPRNIENFDVQEESFYSQTLNFHVPNQYGRMISRIFNLSGKQIRFVKYNVESAIPENFNRNYKDNLLSLKIHLVQAIRENFEPGYEYLTHALAITTRDDYDLYDSHQRIMIPYPAAYIYYKMSDWGKFNDKLLASDRFGLPLIKHWNHEQIIQQLLIGNETDEQKLYAVYNYIRTNVKWNGEYKLFVTPVFNNSLSKIFTRITKKLSNEKSLRKPFEKKEGTSSEINFLLIYLLNRAGIQTDPVIISTKNNGLIDTLIKEPEQFNHTLALANIGEKQYLLDATDSLRPLGFIGEDKLSGMGFIVKKENYGWINLTDAQLTKSSIVEKIEIDENLNQKKNISVSQSGYYALNNRRAILVQGVDGFKKKMTTEMLRVDNYTTFEIKNLERDSLPLDFILVSETINPGKNELEVIPSLNPVFSGDDFAQAFRSFPVDLGFPFRWNYLLEIQYPGEYSIEYPENENFSVYGGNANFNYKIVNNGEKILLSIKLELKTEAFPNYEYENLARLFKSLDLKLQEKIIFRRN